MIKSLVQTSYPSICTVLPHVGRCEGSNILANGVTSIKYSEITEGLLADL